MGKLHSVEIKTKNQVKEISVFCDDVTAFSEPIDILTTSAFVGSYEPTPFTVFEALDRKGISVQYLSESPEIDLREPCHTWLSREIGQSLADIGRIGCIELIGALDFYSAQLRTEQEMINSVRAYFRMLDIAHIYGVKMDVVAMPLLGSGSQELPIRMLLVPLLNECISFLKRNDGVKKICFIEINENKAKMIKDALSDSLRFAGDEKGNECEEREKIAFISCSSKDKNIADNLCFKLESRGIKTWYAPRDVNGPYAESIVNAIEKATHFIVILSRNSICSEHVLNEIDLAFQKISAGLKFKPLRIDDALFTPSFKYYLSRQHWMDATIPPLEARLDEFIESID